MKTRRYIIKSAQDSHDAIVEAGLILRNGGLVAFPTETVYGLGANALDPSAVRKIFKAKKRPADNPLIVHIGYKKDLNRLVRHIPAQARLLINKFWPGSLTLILEKSDLISEIVSCGLPTVAVRMPSSPVALSLIRSAGVPVAAPSANRSGKPSPTTAEHVIEDLDGRINAVIDAGNTHVGIESTVLDLTVDPPVILRPGFITEKQIRRCIGTVNVYKGGTATAAVSQPRSPGMKYRHYAPDARLIIVRGKETDVHRFIARQAGVNRKRKLKTGILTTKKNHRYQNADIIYIGSSVNMIGRNLFSALREFNRLGVDVIYSESIPEKDFGKAVMNRLKKAAGYEITEL